MDTTAINSSVVFSEYWNVIKNWSDEMKVALIVRLSDSIKNYKANENAKSWAKYFGMMKDDNFPTGKEIDEFVADEYEDIENFVV